MSTHDTETGKEHKPSEQQPASIDTQYSGPEQQAQPSLPTQQQPSPPQKTQRKRWLLVTLIILLVAVLVIMSFGVAALLQQKTQPVPTPTPKPTGIVQPSATTPPTPTPSTPTPSPVTGQWISVLSGYKVTSTAAAPSNGNVLYACAVPPGQSPNLAGVETVLRSTDFGNHWQDIGSNAQMSRGCELAINPNDSNEIYVATSSNPATDQTVTAYVIKHTSNGGDSWETFQPTIHIAGQQNIDWEGSQFYAAGNRLFSLQRISISITPTPATSTRLLVSTDGGHTWNVLDTQFAQTQQSAWTYAVNPLDTSIMYEIVGLPNAVPGQFPKGEFYKSTDGGNTWTLQPSLTQITGFVIMPTILIGSAKPETLYITNTPCTSQALRTGSGALLVQRAGGSFNLCMSSNGGTNWQNITAPTNQALSLSGGQIDAQGSFYDVATNSANLIGEIWRYDASNNAWSKVVSVPAAGSIQSVTSAGTHGNVAIWFLANVQGKYQLYRYETP